MREGPFPPSDSALARARERGYAHDAAWPTCSQCDLVARPGARCDGPAHQVRVCPFTQRDENGAPCLAGGILGVHHGEGG